MKYDSIIFDLDGTLWDTSTSCAIAWNNVILRNKINFREIFDSDIKKVAGKPHNECIRNIFTSLSENEIKTLIDETLIEVISVISKSGGKIYDGVIEGLESLSKNYKLFIVSNCQSGYIEKFLSINNLQDLFSDFECWGNSYKPKTINTKNLIAKNYLKNPIFIGDTKEDFIAAQNVSIDFIQACYGFGEEIEVCKKIINFQDLLKFL